MEKNIPNKNNEPIVNAGLGMGVAKGHTFYKEILDLYSRKIFVIDDHGDVSDTVVSLIIRRLKLHGLTPNIKLQCVDGIWTYPVEYFCPKNILQVI